MWFRLWDETIVGGQEFVMKKTALFSTLLAALSVSVAVAAPPAKKAPAKKPAPKKPAIVDVWTCPITGDKVDPKMQAGKPVVVGHYRVHFCCAGCPSQFAKLTPKEQLAKAEAAYKKDHEVKTNKS